LGRFSIDDFIEDVSPGALGRQWIAVLEYSCSSKISAVGTFSSQPVKKSVTAIDNSAKSRL